MLRGIGFFIFHGTAKPSDDFAQDIFDSLHVPESKSRTAGAYTKLVSQIAIFRTVMSI